MPQKNDHDENTEDRRCQTCKHLGDSNMESSCAPCFGYSNWGAKQFKSFSEVQELNPNGELAPIVAVEKGD